MAEWIDRRTVSEVRVAEKVGWRCSGCQHEWVTTTNSRLAGHGCPSCCGNKKGAFRKHPDFHFIAPYTPKNAKSRDKITPPCSVCCRSHIVSIDAWLRGCRRHHACANPKREDWQISPLIECLDAKLFVESSANDKLPFRCVAGHVFLSRKRHLHSAAINGTSGCPHCSGKTPITARLSQEAPDILAVGPSRRQRQRWQSSRH